MSQIKPQMTFDRKNYRQHRNKKRIIIVNQTRFIIATLVSLIVLSVIISYFSGFFMSEAATVGSSITLEIVEGDTLWDIANQYNYYNEDVREVVYRIKNYNHLDNSEIIVGQNIEIPLNNN